MSRRLRSEPVQRLLKLMENRLKTLTSDPEVENLVKAIDGKPLPVGGNSKDPDAAWGRGAGGLAKGYKLHAVWSTGTMPQTWEVTALNTSEKEVAYRLIGQLTYGGYLLADGEYDASYLYDRAFEKGYQLVAP